MMYWLLAAGHLIVVLALTIRVFIRQDITDPARLAWFIAFASLPILGCLIYLLFGEIYISDTYAERHAKSSRAIQRLGPRILGDQKAALYDIAPEHHGAFCYSTSINGFAPTQGNRFELLDGPAVFSARLIEDIDKASDSVCLLYYIWLDDNTGTEVAEAVMRAARRGVTCRIMVDEFGSRGFLKTDLWEGMKQAGAQCYIAMPVERIHVYKIINRFDLRNHRKITVIDGRIAYCGSRNCADPEFRLKPKYAPWVDVMTRVEGPAVNQMLALFAADWVNTVPGESFDGFSFDAEPVEGGCIAQVRGTGPLERRFSAIQAFVAAIYGARSSLMITTPYFVPDNSILYALSEAALSGVQVTLNLPARNDSWIVSAASKSTYVPLLRSGVRIFEYRPGLLHSKIMTIDDTFSTIGSSNLDLRSLGLNYENDMLIYDKTATAAIRDLQESYLAESNEVALADVEAWSASRRVYYNLMGTLGPLL